MRRRRSPPSRRRRSLARGGKPARTPRVRTRLSICRRKKTYASADAARAAAARFDPALRPYRCDRCGTVHLTSRTKGKRVPRPAPPATAHPAGETDYAA